VQDLVADMLERGLSPRTIKYAHTLLNDALGHAVRWRLLPNNPAQHVTLPRQERNEMRVLSKKQVTAFLEAAEGDRYYTLFLLAIATGIRSGELLGLQWKDVDMQRATVAVHRTLVRIGTNWSFTEPKTARSKRRIALPHSVLPVLRTHRKQQAEERLMCGEKYDDHDLVFATATGKPLRRRNLNRRHFKPILDRADLPDIRFHDLRHTCATLLLAEGENPKVVSERLGHSSITLTLDTYSHVLPNMQRKAADKLEVALFGGT